ncbi:hypothetical protein BY458DRAFT_530546 [Sporodiniella umbellata]|nr:hypothetical protein BY458DRAFT_530546 [Sporodiniella umbellata]
MPCILACAIERLELLFVMATLLLILVFANEYLQPIKRVIRKRGLLIASILISALFTTFVTRLLPLTIALSKAPLLPTIVSVMSFQWFLYICVVTLKKCFTLGEMTIISQAGAILVYGTMEYIYIACTVDSNAGVKDISVAYVLIHILIIGMVFIGMVAYPILRESRKIAQQPYWRSNDNIPLYGDKKVLLAILFYIVTAAIVLFIFRPFCKALTGQDPFIWTIRYLYISPPRIFLCLYWILMIATTVVMWVIFLDFTMTRSLNNIESKNLTASLNLKRKVFHGLAVIMFIPGALFEFEFLQLAFGIAISIFIYLEYLRYFAVWPWGKNLHIFLTEFIDNRDLGPVILSHLYLLIGCASPIWIESTDMLASLSGILVLGFGDSAASIVGKQWGRHTWPGSKKTVEGTIAFFLTVLISSFVILHIGAIFSPENSSSLTLSSLHWPFYSTVVLATALLEAFSSQNDNIILPLFMYSLIVAT